MVYYYYYYYYFYHYTVAQEAHDTQSRHPEDSNEHIDNYIHPCLW